MSPRRDPSWTAPEPSSTPGNRGERLARLGDRIAELSARIQAATYELLVLIRQFDERGGWDGCVSCAQWLSWRAGLAPGAAREHVRVARALGKLPKLSDAMRRGKISYSKVRAVTRVATPDNEDDLLYVCSAGTAAHVERIARAWRRIDRNVEQVEERRQQASRGLRTWVDEDGMVVVRGRLPPDVGAVLRRALEAAGDQARRASLRDDGGEVGGEVAAAGAPANAPVDAEESTFEQRQADAIGVVAEAALAGGLDRGTAGDRYQVVLHVDAEALAERRDVPAGTPGARRRRTSGPCPGARPTTAASEAPSRAHRRATSGPVPSASPVAARQTVLDEAGGVHVSAETARRLACDAATVTMHHGPGGEILDVGRRTRNISPALRRALAARDRQCRFPGCGNRRCDAHHVEHWADGGRTSLDNLVLLCRRHHRAVHEGGFRVTVDAAGALGSWGLTAAPGRRRRRRRPGRGPRSSLRTAPLPPLASRSAPTATPSWGGERLDLDWAMHVLWRPRREPPAE